MSNKFCRVQSKVGVGVGRGPRGSDSDLTVSQWLLTTKADVTTDIVLLSPLGPLYTYFW